MNQKNAWIAIACCVLAAVVVSQGACVAGEESDTAVEDTGGSGVEEVGEIQQALAPDEWHCTIANAADDLCIKMNQFLGWWTGFDVEYRYRGLGFYPVMVQLAWENNRNQSGSWPDTNVFWDSADENFQRGTWADLPIFTCVTGRAHVTPLYGPAPRTYQVTVCR